MPHSGTSAAPATPAMASNIVPQPAIVPRSQPKVDERKLSSGVSIAFPPVPASSLAPRPANSYGGRKGGRMEEFDFVMIKPSHYDDDGYPIVWWRTLIPSNSLAAVNGIARDCIDRQVLGPNVRINLTTVDETNTHIVPSKIAGDLQKRGARALI